MPTYKIVIVGARGSGKTLFLASMYNKLSSPGKNKIFLEADINTSITDPTDGSEKNPRQLLVDRYANLADFSKEWEPGTVDIERWEFGCKVQRPNDFKTFLACDFTYLDYAGGDLIGNQNPELENELQQANSLLGLLDGQTILSVMNNEGGSYSKLTTDLGNMIPLMSQKSQPVHFVISKWDLIDGKFSLEQIRDRLLEEEKFSDFIQSRIDGNSSVRLIPVSAVGMGFAALQENGEMKKIPGKRLKPFQVEMPLACILPDQVKSELQKVAQRKQQILEKKVDYSSSQVGFWDSILDAVATTFDWVRENMLTDLPSELRFTEQILKKFSQAARAGAGQTREQQENRIRDLEKQRNNSLKDVDSEETALNYAIDIFLEMQAKLDYNFPASEIKLPQNNRDFWS